MKRTVLISMLLASSTLARAQQGWQSVSALGGDGRQYYRQVYLPSASSIWLLRGLYPVRQAAGYQISYSADNGQSWQTVDIAQSAPDATSQITGTECVDLFALDAQTAWIIIRDVAAGTRILKQTSTGPTGFQAANTPALADLSSVTFLNATTGIATGSISGQMGIMRTTDGGATWTAVSVPAAPSGLTSKRIVQGQHIWLGLSAGMVLHSADAGLTWVLSNTGLGRLTGIAFRDALHGLAYSATNASGVRPGLLAATNDGGATWTTLAPSGRLMFNDVEAVAGTSTYLASGNDIVNAQYRGLAYSTDEGQTWQATGPDLPFSTSKSSGPGRVWATLTYNSSPLPPRTDYLVYQLTGSLLSTKVQKDVAGQACFPNPTTGLVYLPLGQSYRQVQVYDATGRCCRTLNLTAASTQFDIRGLEQGLYQVVLRNSAGELSSQRLMLTE